MILAVQQYGNVVCLQMELDDRELFIEQISQLENLSNSIRLESDRGVVKLTLTESEFEADAGRLDSIVIKLRSDDLSDLVDAVEEHIDGEITFPLDHSLESAGARIMPPNVRDVVIETVNDEAKGRG